MSNQVANTTTTTIQSASKLAIKKTDKKNNNMASKKQLLPKKKFKKDSQSDDEPASSEEEDAVGALSPESEEEDDYGDEDNDNGGAYPAHGRKGGVPEKVADDDDQWFSDSSASDGGEDKEARLVMYAAWTQYDVVKEVGKTVFGYHLTKNEQREWDVAWFDGPISIKLLQKMWPHQRTNHFPGMYNLARKNCLGRHLMRMYKWFPNDYNFFPQTYMLPTDYKEFKNQITAKRNKTFIVKPEASCQGKGIFLTRGFEDIEPSEHYVVQRYMAKPYLIDGYKFDLRIYVLLAGVNPLRVFLYKEGLARFATVPYESPQPSNLQNLFMHLTNYAINKDSDNFIPNMSETDDDVGSKRSYTSVLKRIRVEFGEKRCQQVIGEIKDLIIKTLCIAQPILQHLYKSCQPDDIENSLCCHVLGFDIMLDHNLSAQLLEVNQSPSFTTDSPLDYRIKQALIKDTIGLWNLSVKRKLRLKGDKRAQMQRRLLNYQNPNAQPKEQPQAADEKKGTGIVRSQMGSATNPQMSKVQLQKQQIQDEREQLRKKKMLHREKFERDNCGQYELIYPLVSYQEEFDIIAGVIPAPVRAAATAQPEKEGDDKQKNQEKDSDESESEDDENTVFEENETPWEKQQKYLTFMDKAKNLWESFTNGNATYKKRKFEEEQKELKEKEAIEKKEKQRKKAVLQAKIKKDIEERKLRLQEESQKKMETMMQQQQNLLEEVFQEVVQQKNGQQYIDNALSSYMGVFNQQQMGIGQLQMQNFNFSGNNAKKGIHEDYLRQFARYNMGPNAQQQMMNMGIQFESMNLGDKKMMAAPAVVPALTNQGQISNYSHHFQFGAFQPQVQQTHDFMRKRKDNQGMLIIQQLNPGRVGGAQELDNSSGAAYNDRNIVKPAMNTASNQKTSNYLQDILLQKSQTQNFAHMNEFANQQLTHSQNTKGHQQLSTFDISKLSSLAQNMSHSNLGIQNSRVNNSNPNQKSHQSKASMLNNSGLNEPQRNLPQRQLESILTQQASQKQGNFAVLKKQVNINQDGIIKSIAQDYLSPQNVTTQQNRLLPQILVMTNNPHSVGRNPQIAMGLNINKNLQSTRDQSQFKANTNNVQFKTPNNPHLKSNPASQVGSVNNLDFSGHSYPHMPAYSDAEAKINKNTIGSLGGFGIVGEKKNFDGGPRGKIHKPTEKSPKRTRDKFQDNNLQAPKPITTGLNIINSKELYSLLH